MEMKGNTKKTWKTIGKQRKSRKTLQKYKKNIVKQGKSRNIKENQGKSRTNIGKIMVTIREPSKTIEKQMKNKISGFKF